MKILASRALMLLSLAAASMSLKSALGAQQTIWQGSPAIIGDWFEPANWTNGLPADDDYQSFAMISNGGTARVAAGAASAAQLYLGETLSGKLVVDGGRVDVLYNAYFGLASEAGGFLTLNGGTFAANSVVMGYNRGKGAIEQTGGTLDADFVQLGSPHYLTVELPNSGATPQDYGSGFYHLQGGRLTATQVDVGNSGVGVFRQEGGVATIEQRLIVGGEIASLPPIYNGPITWVPDPIIVAPWTPVPSYSTDLWIAPPVPSNGRYELSGGSLSVRHMEVAKTGTVEHIGGTLHATYLEVAAGASYAYEGGSLNIAAGLHAAGGFNFAGSSAKLVAGDAILNFAAGLANAQHARIEAGPKSLTILPAGFNPQTDLGSLATQGLVHHAGNDLTIPAGRSVEGWGRIDDHAVVAGSITAVDELATIHLNGLELLSSGNVELHRGVLNVKNDRTVIRGGEFAAEGITVNGDSTLDYLTPNYTPGLARQTGGSVEVDYVSISHGRYEISGGTLTTSSFDVGGRQPFLGTGPKERSVVQRGGVVTTRNLNLSLPYFIDVTLDRPASADYSLIGWPSPFLAQPARYELHQGSLNAERVNVGMGVLGSSAEFIHTGGEFNVSQFLSISGQGSSYLITGGNLRTRRLFIGNELNAAEPDGAFSILNKNVTIEIAGELRFGSSANFVAVPGSTIRLTRPAPPVQYEHPVLTGNNVAIHATDSDALSGLSNLTLIFEGGADLPATFEAAGEDRGPSLAGFYQNFTLDTLVIGGVEPAALSLVDLIANNVNATIPNAVYVEHLVINAGSTLDLNGIKLYYRTADVAAGEALALGSYGTQVVPEPSAAMLLVAATPWVFRRRSRWLRVL